MAKLSSARAWAEGKLEKARVFCASSVVKNAELSRIAKGEVAKLREEFLKGQEELLKDFSKKMSDLGEKVVSLTSANEAIQKEKEEDSALLAKALADNAELQAKVDSLKKGSKKKKKIKELEKEVANLQNEVDDLGVEKDKAIQATKVAFQDDFCLARHQVLKKYPDLDFSFLAALDIPEEP